MFWTLKRYMVLVLSVLSLTAPMLVFAYTSPGPPKGYVNDFAQILTLEQEEELEATVQLIEKRTSDEIAVVTIPTTKEETIEQYAVQLFEEWGIGKAGQDNGVLLLLAIQDRKLRIEVGYGVEGLLTDARSARIIRDATPLLKQERYHEAIQGMLVGIESTLSGEGSSLTGSGSGDEMLMWLDAYRGIMFVVFFVISLFMFFVFRFIVRTVFGLIAYILMYLFSLLTGRPRPLWKSYFGGSWRGFLGGFFSGLGRRGGGGGFSGGGSSFGGGRSGGGGSSGSW